VKTYQTLRWLLQIACQAFFRRIEVVGREDVPQDGAVIFCGNHPNSLLDPILITASCGRVVHFAAKDTLFDNPIARWLLTRMGAVPVRRRMDHGEGPQDNTASLDALVEVLGEGSAVGIFPEGISHDASQLAPLKTGAARIAQAVARRWPGLPVRLVPCGLVYFTRDRFRSSVLVQYGAPIAVDPAEGEEADRAQVVELTARLAESLRALTINAGSWETIVVLDAVRRLYQPDGITLEDRGDLARRFNAHYPTVAEEPEVRALYRRVSEYQQRMSSLGVEDAVLRHPPTPRQIAARIVGHLALILFWGPLAILGAPIHAPLGLLFKVLGKRVSPRTDVVATTKFLLGFFGGILTYLGLAIAVGWRSGWPWGVATLLILPLSGRAFIHVIARVDALRRLATTTARVLVLRREITALRTERAALEADVAHAIERLRPAAGMEL
jgi:glycerol-3-phosphate O-acyltransferase/dihydroxyacetone phosphate acyltransferase